jgi:two-component system, LytTR family, sensor kinase
MKRYFSLIFGCMVASALTFGQSSRDLKIIEKKHFETQQMFEAINKANGLLNKQPEEALDEVEKALKLSYSNKNKRGEAYSYQTLGAIYYRLNSFTESVNYYQKALALFKGLNDTKSQYIVYKHLGPAFESSKQLNQAASTYKTFLKLAIARNNPVDEIMAKESLGRILFNSGKFQQANNYYQQLLLAYKTAKKTDLLPTTYEHIGMCYAGLKDTTQALKYFNLAGVLSEEYSTEDQQLNSWQQVSRSYKSVGKLDKSVEYEKKALEVNKKRGKKKDIISNNANIASDYLFMNKAHEAIPFLEDNINLAEEIGEVKSTGEAYKSLSDAYAQLGKMDDAKSNFEKYRNLQEEILFKKEAELNEREANTSGLFDKEKQIELLVKDKELDEEKIRLLEQERLLRAKAMQEQRRLTYILVVVLSLLIIGLILLYRSVKQKQIANKLLSIRSLRSQMNPHFIFNSLNSVNSFISKSDERSANKYLTEFARLMRTVLDHSRKDFVTLADEISVLQRYLNLEHIRFSEHFDFELNVDDDLQTDKLLIPPMLVQPYVENAIWHGLRYLESKGQLVVSFRGTEDSMRIEVLDNGIGRKKSQELKTRNQKVGTSTGISNTKSRLKLLNEVHRLKLSAELTDANEDGSGTRVVLELPYIDVDDKRYAEV